VVLGLATVAVQKFQGSTVVASAPCGELGGRDVIDMTAAGSG
jgi:hypothetical protein